jgi:hypothetical protein
MAIHANSRRTSLSRPPSRTRRRTRFPAFPPFGDDTPTALDVLMALPPQTRRAIIDRREGRF